MKAPERIYVEVCEDGIYAFSKPPFAESVEYVRADVVEQPAEGLEEEVKRYWNEHALEHRIGRVADIDFLQLAARHFAEWGAKNLKK